MKVLKTVVLGLLALCVLLGLIGFALPSGYKVERSIDINAPMIAVYPLVYNPKAWTGWSVWSRRDPAMKISYAGPPAGIGAKWSWQSHTEGSGSMEFTAADFDKRIAYKISFANFDGAFSGRFEFAPNGKGVRVSWIAEGDMGTNPLKRYFVLLMDRMMGPDFEAGMKNLKVLAERPQ